ncbi:hypothetical protein FACS1894217_00460 [Clostridia bacterium]|nr:hypothetical protein FACS1894217_00460 [Clostridia bacterium]
MPYTNQNTFSQIQLLVTAAGGLSLSQICTITGLEGGAIQNWVKRGWVGGSVKSKKYNEQQVASILILNALRGCLRFEDIANLLSYAKGLIEPGDLFGYMCQAVRNVGTDLGGAERVIDGILAGQGERLRKVLSVMVHACICAELSQTANLKLRELV